VSDDTRVLTKNLKKSLYVKFTPRTSLVIIIFYAGMLLAK
jgi:hypothetical protein